MFRSSMVRFLNKYSFLQFIFVCLPLIMVIIYGYAYMTDMLGIAGTLEYNNVISERAWGSDELLKVIDTKRGEDGQVTAIVGREFENDVTVAVDDVILYVQAYSPYWHKITTSADEYIMQSECSLFDAEELTDTTMRVTYGDDINIDFEVGDLICGVSVSDEGLWRVTFLGGDFPYYDLEELHMLELISVQDDSYTVSVTASYEVDFDELDVNFCSNLPSSSLYYNEATGSFVRNVSKDYGFTFILRSNIAIVFISMLLYYILMYQFIASEKEVPELVKNVYIKRANVFAICLLPLGVFITMILL